MPSKRLLVVTESLGIGGTESHLLRMLPRLREFGWNVVIFCMSGRGKLAPRLEAAGVEVASVESVVDRETFRYCYMPPLPPASYTRLPDVRAPILLISTCPVDI